MFLTSLPLPSAISWQRHVPPSLDDWRYGGSEPCPVCRSVFPASLGAEYEDAIQSGSTSVLAVYRDSPYRPKNPGCCCFDPECQPVVDYRTRWRSLYLQGTNHFFPSICTQGYPVAVEGFAVFLHPTRLDILLAAFGG